MPVQPLTCTVNDAVRPNDSKSPTLNLTGRVPRRDVGPADVTAPVRRGPIGLEREYAGILSFVAKVRLCV